MCKRFSLISSCILKKNSVEINPEIGDGKCRWSGDCSSDFTDAVCRLTGSAALSTDPDLASFRLFRNKPEKIVGVALR